MTLDSGRQPGSVADVMLAVRVCVCVCVAARREGGRDLQACVQHVCTSMGWQYVRRI